MLQVTLTKKYENRNGENRGMAVKKSELYSLLWEACNKLRGGVEPSRYKDYVLVLLFFKYVSDRYRGKRFAEFTISEGASFDDLIAAKGKSGRAITPVFRRAKCGGTTLIHRIMWIGTPDQITRRWPRHGATIPFPARAVSKPIVKHGAGGMARPGRFHVREINKTEGLNAMNIMKVFHCRQIRLSDSGSVITIQCQKLILPRL